MLRRRQKRYKKKERAHVRYHIKTGCDQVVDSNEKLLSVLYIPAQYVYSLTHKAASGPSVLSWLLLQDVCFTRGGG